MNKLLSERHVENSPAGFPFLVRNRAAALCDRIQQTLGYGNVAKACADYIRSMPVSADDSATDVQERAALICDQVQSELGFGRTADFCAQQIRESPTLLDQRCPADPWAMPVVRPEFEFTKDQREKIEAAFDAAIRKSPVLCAYYGLDQEQKGDSA